MEFPKRDFAKLLAGAQKSKQTQMELQLVKKQFYKAVFDSNSSQGFATTTVSIQRNTAKRNSIINLNNEFRPVYNAPQGQANLGLPVAK